LEIEEKREIHRILLALTALVHNKLDELVVTLETLTDIDELYARGRLALRWDGVAPELNTTGRVRIFKGRHPLLIERLKNNVVPLTIEIEPPVRTLVISGPNAGGKTVALKTVGLLSLLAAAGYFVPAASGTELPFFNGVHADIGDAQSIESDLSTFTGHLAKLSEMVNDKSSPKLILVDEIGSSTDPAIGAALAQSVLLDLTKQNAVSIVTTHHGSLKSFAHETEGLANGSMAFDEKSLEPTYLFRPGIPGSSYALEIAQRVGFPKKLLDDARGYLGKGELGLEDLVSELSRKIEEYEKLRKESDLKLTKYEALSKLYEERAAEIKKIKAQAKKEALAEAEELVDRARRDMENVIREIKESSAAKEVITSARKRLLDRRGEIAASKKQVERQVLNESEIAKPLETVAIGDRVPVEDWEGAGKIVAIQKNGKRVEVEMNGTRLWVDRNRLRTPMEAEKKLPQRVNIEIKTQTEYVPGSLDLRGKYGDEAIPMIDSYLTAAAQQNYKEVMLIHGKGTGSLRVKVREFLETHPLVKGYHDGGPNMDDFGSTAVELN
jgi:DNA mismatch repair protein MutS2